MNTQCYVPRLSKNERNHLFFIGKLDLGMTEKIIYSTLAIYACGKNYTFVSQETIGKMCSCSVRTVQRAVSELQRLGWLLTVTEGRLRKYYFTVPEQYRGDLPIHDNLSPIEAQKPDNVATYDNLSPVFNNSSLEENNTIPPISPQEATRLTGGGNISLQEQKEKKDTIFAGFRRLAAAYPRKEGYRMAADVYRRMYADLPPIDDLLKALEYEKLHNSRWQRDQGRWITWLHNWIQHRHWADVLEIMSMSPVSATRSAVTPAPGSEPGPGPGSGQENGFTPNKDFCGDSPVPVSNCGPTLPFDEEEFARCIADNWQLSAQSNFFAISLRGIWNALLKQGLKPTQAEARSASALHSCPMAWLRDFKRQKLEMLAA